MDEATIQYITTRYTTDPEYSDLLMSAEEVQNIARTLAAQARFQEVMELFDYNNNQRVSTLNTCSGIDFITQFNSLDKSRKDPPTVGFFRKARGTEFY